MRIFLLVSKLDYQKYKFCRKKTKYLIDDYSYIAFSLSPLSSSSSSSLFSLDCYDLFAASRTASPIHNCMREWRNKLTNVQYGASENITYAYKHVSYYGMHKRAARYVGLERAKDVIYVRISRPEHVKAKQDRYYRYGFLSNMIVSGICSYQPLLLIIHYFHRLLESFLASLVLVLSLPSLYLLALIS
jgi:hypothetical protein